MTDFERALVRGFNDYFESDNHPFPTGFAMRDQQSQYQKQVTDVIVWKPDVFIECKSLKTSSSGGVGFRSHFNTEDESEGNKHQIERETEILNRAGVKGLLALELCRGRGKSKKAYLIDWSLVYQRWNDEEEMNSIRFRELEDLCQRNEDEVEPSPVKEIPREDQEWKITNELFEWIQAVHG